MTEEITSTMETVVPQPPETVWAIVTDLDNWHIFAGRRPGILRTCGVRWKNRGKNSKISQKSACISKRHMLY